MEKRLIGKIGEGEDIVRELVGKILIRDRGRQQNVMQFERVTSWSLQKKIL